MEMGGGLAAVGLAADTEQSGKMVVRWIPGGKTRKARRLRSTPREKERGREPCDDLRG